MILTKSCIYGLRASVLLASRRDDKYVNIQEVSDQLGISFHFLTKILQQLTQAGILESYKGPNGGVRLARDPNSIMFEEIIVAIDKDHALANCIMGLPECGELEPCPVHNDWIQLKEKIENLLKQTTLSDLASRNQSFSDHFHPETNEDNLF